jgi:hypothetical protein
MRATCSWAAAISCVLGACQLPAGAPSRGSAENAGARPALSCAPRDSSWPEVQSLYDSTTFSTDELIACGGLQVQIAGRIVWMLIASNKDLFKEDERAIIDDIALNPFSRTDDGHWTMTIDSAQGSTFTLAFYDPDTGERIRDDVFDLDTYLAGVHVQSEVDIAEMLQHPDRRYGFAFTWSGPGPLAHMLNAGAPLPDGFTLQLSITDFIQMQPADFGPFQSLFALELDSTVDYVTHDPDADIEYRVSAVRDSLDHIATHAALAFTVDHLAGTHGELALHGTSKDLAYVMHGVLAGSVDYDLSGTLDGRAVDMHVLEDFGPGSSMPTTTWRCK